MSSSKQTILELCMSPDLGGLELYMVRAAKALSDDFNVISVINENSKLEQYYDESDKFVKIKKKRINSRRKNANRRMRSEFQ
jgi:hypothetical protein